jgi:hypothetical protein
MLAPVQTADPQSNGHGRFQQPQAEPPAAEHAADQPAFSRARARIAEIERLWLEGYSTYEIAEQMGERPRDVGRNLREIRKRMQRAAQRQSQALLTHCAEIGREAMDAWRRSQGTHHTVTTRQRNGCLDTVTTRTEEKPGNAAFLNAALRATKTLGQLAAELPAAASRKSADAARLALMEVLTPEQSLILSPEQREECAAAFHRWKEQLTAGNAPNRADAEAHEAVAGADDPLPPEAVAEPQNEPRGDKGPVEGESPICADTKVGTVPVAPAASDGPTPSERNGDRRPTVRRAVAIRHPEWPAESFLSRAWLPPDRRLTPGAPACGSHENAACGADFQSACAANGKK